MVENKKPEIIGIFQLIQINEDEYIFSNPKNEELKRLKPSKNVLEGKQYHKLSTFYELTVINNTVTFMKKINNFKVNNFIIKDKKDFNEVIEKDNFIKKQIIDIEKEISNLGGTIEIRSLGQISGNINQCTATILSGKKFDINEFEEISDKLYLMSIKRQLNTIKNTKK